MKRRAALADEPFTPIKKQRTMGLNRTQQLAVTREVKKELNKRTDFKYTDVSSLTASVNSAGSVASLYANLVRGSLAFNNFDGDTVIPKYLQVKYAIQSSVPASGNVFNTMRVIIGQSKLIGTPTVANVLDSNFLNTVNAPLALRQFDRLKGYKILYDRIHTQNYLSNYGDVFNVFIPGKRLISTEFTSSGALSITRGDLFIIAVSDDGITDFPDIQFTSRVVFSD